MSRTVSHILLSAALVLWAACATAQTKAELEKQKQQLLKDIEFTNRLLSETEKNKKLTLNELTLMKTRISQRQELINNVARQAKMVEKQIGETRVIVTALEEDLKRLKEEYAKMLYYTYKNQNRYDRLMFILSSKDINQAYKRVKYFQQYAKHRQEQAAAIEATQAALKVRSAELTAKRKELSNLMEDGEREKLKLSSEREAQAKLVHELQDKERELRQDLKKKDQEAKKLEKAIARVIEEEIRKARTKVEKSDSKMTASGFALTPAEMALSNNFVENRGKLPWPSERGVITSTFGEHPHPTLRDIKTMNNGIDIATDPGSKARAVFDGVVSRVINIPGAHNAVIVKHGEYLTVYANLDDVEVKQGDEVKVKQALGTVVTDREENRTVLHFELWKGAVKQDPSLWVAKAVGR